ncbi:MAG: 2-(1,2-epoxy-1,2-dihydrophenyl)acetyl-CoA isomerase [Planctomycetota bacterium]|jgi:2-(1,2-epoxy-1,2-dihydrophenyl)acetyl-CoA isomerase
METFKTIEFERAESIINIRLNRPDAANGMNTRMAAELKQAAMRCDNDARVKAVVLSASGRFFCAGGDIKEFAAQGDDIGSGVKGLADDLHAAISTFSRMNAAFIVAVNGIAAGAGFSLAMAADLVLAGQSASFTMAYTRAGLCPDGSSSYFLPRLIGLRKTQQLMLTNNTLSAAQAFDLGLVTQVVADDQLPLECQQLAEQLAKGSLNSIAAVKKLLLCSFNNSLETQMELEGRSVAQCAASPDGREGISAFIEKRTPTFK